MTRESAKWFSTFEWLVQVLYVPFKHLFKSMAWGYCEKDFKHEDQGVQGSS